MTKTTVKYVVAPACPEIGLHNCPRIADLASVHASLRGRNALTLPAATAAGLPSRGMID